MPAAAALPPGHGRAGRRLQRLAGHVVARALAVPSLGVSDSEEEYFLKSQYRQRMRELALPAPAAPPFRAEYHTAAGLAREPILQWPKVMAQFDVAEFMRDGVAVFKGIFTPDAARRLVASCENVQRQNDAWLDHDWLKPGQWAALGLKPPAVPPVTAEEKAAARGGCQLMGRSLSRIMESVEQSNGGPRFGTGSLRDSRSMRWPCGTGYIPEHCPMGYDGFLANCITHPQMIELHKLMLGPEVRFDHNTLLSRRDFPGQHWHSHGYVEDEQGVTARPGGARLRLVRSLVYPEGFAKYNDGGLKVVRGAHLYRSVSLEPYRRGAVRPGTEPGFEDDRVFEEAWLAGKAHPITGKPLAIEYLELPPGSMAVCLCHTPHGVSPRPLGSGTRHCTLFSYREPDPEGELPVSTNAGLQPWELERDCALGKMDGVAGGPVNLFSLY